MEHELTFQKIKEQVELPELLSHYGYALKKGEDLGKGKWHVFEGDDTLVVFKGRGGDWMYFNAQDDRDKGSVIDWMKNRVHSGRISGIAQAPDRNVWQAVNDHFRAYLNLPEANRPRLDLPPIAETASGEKFHSIYTKNCRPLENTTFLEGRGITKSTLARPEFSGRILNQFHTVQREGMPAKTYVNTAFPAYHEGRVVGLELKGEGFKGQAPESQFSRSLWLSGLPENGKPTYLLVSESALDALSYAQLHPGDKALFASTAGTLTQNKIFELKRLLNEAGIPTIRAAFDNDTQGHHFDTRLLAGFAGADNPMKVVREHEQRLTVEVTTTNVSSLQALSDKLKIYNADATVHYYQQSGTTEGKAITPTLRSELIHSVQSAPNTFQFHVPMNRDALGAFNQAARQSLGFEHRVEIVKSQGKDWNQDLKQDQLQHVVRRELREVDEDQYGFGQLHWDNPRFEGDGKMPPLIRVPPLDVERQVVVEYRESRDATSQLPALRENLERVGFMLDHAVRLEPQAARELATALTLRYRLDSPQLLTMSDALDALATNPQARVVEPGPDTVERRRQAAVLEEKRQAGPQLVPSESPAHDQARQVFMQAAGQLAKELRQHAAGLDAARLQEVSRQLVRQPVLSGLNRENVEKVLAVVDKLAGLQASPAVQQLRDAVRILQSPLQGSLAAENSIDPKPAVSARESPRARLRP